MYMCVRVRCSLLLLPDAFTVDDRGAEEDGREVEEDEDDDG